MTGRERFPQVATYPAPDVTIEQISGLFDYNLPTLLQAVRMQCGWRAHQ